MVKVNVSRGTLAMALVKLSSIHLGTRVVDPLRMTGVSIK